jgi:hypothetical protein
MYNTRKNIIFFTLIILIALVCVFLAIPKNESSAKAESVSTVVVSKLTRSTLDSTTLTYTNNVEYTENNVYSKNIKIYFDITNSGDVDYYVLGVKEENGEEYTLGNVDVTETESSVEVLYSVENTGTYTITCYIYNYDYSVIASVSQLVKSDMDAPETYASVNSMTKYLIVGTTFSVNIDTSVWSDLLSGEKDLYYSFSYDDSVLVSYTKIVATSKSFSIVNNGVLTLTYIDNAGNYATINYDFDKFDSESPTSPTINVTPNSDMDYSGGYTSSYTVEIIYGTDTEDGSGKADTQYYLLDGVTKQYVGTFIINTSKDYLIKASTIDNVGNKSDVVSVSVDGDTFDTAEPFINSIKFIVDLKNELPCSISFLSTDYESGIDYTYLEDPYVVLTPQVSNAFSASFSCYGKSGLVVHSIDKVGNDSVEHIAISYFGDSSKSEIIESYFNLYHNLDFSLYTESVIEEIDAAYDQLNVALMAESTQNSDFDTIYDEIDSLISGSSNYSYVIETVPTYLSSTIKYTVNENDFENYQMGDSLTLKLNALTLDNENTYLEMASFKTSFAEAFNLSLYYNDELVSSLENGLVIEMNMPYGYYERQFVLINMATEEVVTITTYNNKINFTMQSSGNYVMVISGEKNLTDDSTQKTISVFGKNMPYGTFFGIIFGTLGGVILIVVGLVILKKKSS